MSIGEFLYAARVRRRWTRADLARMTGIEETTIGEIERDGPLTSYARFDRVVNLARALGISPYLLFSLIAIKPLTG